MAHLCNRNIDGNNEGPGGCQKGAGRPEKRGGAAEAPMAHLYNRNIDGDSEGPRGLPERSREVRKGSATRRRRGLRAGLPILPMDFMDSDELFVFHWFSLQKLEQKPFGITCSSERIKNG